MESRFIAPPRLPRQRRLWWSSVAIGVAYGLFARLCFAFERETAMYLGVMTVSFIFGVPFALGFLSVYLSERHGPLSWAHRLSLPILPSLLSLFGALLLAWEGLICIFLWLPLFLTLALVGGLVAVAWRHYFRRRGADPATLAVIALLPFAAAPLEHRLAVPRELRVVTSRIEIAAPAAVVWREIERVPAIAEEEREVTLTQLIGFPRPVEAKLFGSGVGAVRHATFEGGVLFVETIYRWEPERALAFEIAADPDSIPAAALDQHVTVGGPFFDVLTGEYTLEQIAPGRTLLVLASRHRLSTPFNPYAGLWTDFIMSDIQRAILRIIKRRCEHPALHGMRTTHPPRSLAIARDDRPWGSRSG